MEDFINQLTNLGTQAGASIALGLLILIVGLFISKKLVKGLGKGRVLKKLDVGVKSFILSALKAILYALVLSSTAIVWGVPSTVFISLFTTFGVAIGLALQGALGNFAGGLMILIFKPFKVGDYIEGASNSGTVKEITVIYTILETPDNRVVTIPNGSLTNANIINYSALDTRRVDLVVNASYTCDCEKVKKVLNEVAKANEKILKDPAPIIRMLNHGSSSIEYVFRVWTKTADYWDVYFDSNEAIKKAFDENGIEIPYQKIDVNIVK
ncbi:MAG: mechanosensitive ion channel [Lachnospiraceae bacterium]|nr:mechanosensitive ion channel [Lachnospiraceae bacterium]